MINAGNIHAVCAGKQRFPDHAQRAGEHTQRTAERSGRNTQFRAEQLFQQRIDEEAWYDTHVEQIAAEREQTAVTEQQTLHGQDHAHHEVCRHRSEHRCEQKSAADMSRGAGSRDRKIHHLCRKYCCACRAHKQRLRIFLLEFGTRSDYCAARAGSECAAYCGRNQCACDMHK